MAVMHSIYREPGRVYIDEKSCNRCGHCMMVCPEEIVTVTGRGIMVIVLLAMLYKRIRLCYGIMLPGRLLMLLPA